MATIVGIDPGFAHLGFAVVTLDRDGARVANLGTIATKKTDKKQRVLAADDNVRRARELWRPLQATIAPANMVCAEKMSFPRNASAAAKMAMSWGLIVACLEQHALPLLQASPQDVKRRVCGDAAASKAEVQAALVKRFGRGLVRMVKHLPAGQHEHAFDALAAVVACLDSEEGRMLVSMIPS